MSNAQGCYDLLESLVPNQFWVAKILPGHSLTGCYCIFGIPVANNWYYLFTHANLLNL
jgi:hypothetical protein